MVKVPNDIELLLEHFGKPRIVVYGFRKIPGFSTSWVVCHGCKTRYLALYPTEWTKDQLVKLRCNHCKQRRVHMDVRRFG